MLNWLTIIVMPYQIFKPFNGSKGKNIGNLFHINNCGRQFYFLHLILKSIVCDNFSCIFRKQ